MDRKIRVLAINPGSTSTKVALFEDYNELFSVSVDHSREDLKPFSDISGQLEYRSEMIEKTMIEKGFNMADVDVFSGRGGGVNTVPGGVYKVTDLLAGDAAAFMSGNGHPAQLGPQLAKRYADKYGKSAVVVNPPDTDEFYDVARITGLKGVYRESHVHALNQKEIALRFCAENGYKYEETNLIICHLGGGISITAHNKSRMIDSNDIIKGSGPMTPTRAGDLPYMDVIDLAYSGKYTRQELIDRCNKNGGLTDLFGTAEVRDIIKLADDGNYYAGVVLNALAYQISKYIGAMAVALKGNVAAIILTGGISNGTGVTDLIDEYVGWIAKVVIMPGEFELEALAAGAVRAMRGEEELKTYTGVPVWDGVAAQNSIK